MYIHVCDPFWENVPKVEKTNIKIRLKTVEESIETPLTLNNARINFFVFLETSCSK